ncbi:hypothetical protein [Actinoplanes friuliensis]|jgi:hypothetical protein|uniref:hypothetical protein n=1 Tax=Actinoplanes friuliensis TaxID=196914 RepID=UPI0005A11E0E|nr:hypothetical protein [Actinoplanes friuliensis]
MPEDEGVDEEVVPRDSFLRRLEQRHGLSALVALATFAALLVGVLAAVPDWRDMLTGDDTPAAPAPVRTISAVPVPSASLGPGLEAIDLVVRDPAPDGDPADVDTTFSPPAVEITVHNRNARRTVVTRVVVTVEDSAVMKQCASQGGPVGVSATYDVTLPLRPATGTEVRVPVSQQQGSDEADRFALRLGTPARESPTMLHLYRLRFELEADGDTTRLPAGTAVVAVPMAPSDGDGYFWSEMYDSGEINVDDVPDRDRILACMKDNSATLVRLLADGAELSPDFTAIKPVLRL